MKILITFIFLLLNSFVFSQNDSTKVNKFDKAYLNDGIIYEGTVIKVKKSIVTFKEKETSLIYDLDKSDIKVIILSNGKALTYSDYEVKKTDTEPSAAIIILSLIAVAGLIYIIGSLSK